MDHSLFSPMQLKILKVLSDGQRHTKDEIRQAIDPYLSNANIATHISNMRKILQRFGQDIVCVFVGAGPVRYLHVRLLRSSHSG